MNITHGKEECGRISFYSQTQARNNKESHSMVSKRANQSISSCVHICLIMFPIQDVSIHMLKSCYPDTQTDSVTALLLQFRRYQFIR